MTRCDEGAPEEGLGAWCPVWPRDIGPEAFPSVMALVAARLGKAVQSWAERPPVLLACAFESRVSSVQQWGR